MEFLLFLILILVAYIAIKVRNTSTAGAAILRYYRVRHPKEIRGKKTIQVDILIPKRLSKTPVNIEYEVRSDGLVKTIEASVLSNFDSLSQEGNYLFGEDFKIVCCPESPFLGGPHGVVASLVMRQKFAIQGEVHCSSQAFDLISEEMTNQKPVLLRVFGPLVRKESDLVQVMSSSFQILTEDARSGPRYFCDLFKKYISEADENDTKLLRSCIRHFDLNGDLDD